MKDLRCIFEIHIWKRVGITKPIRRVSDFVEREYIGHCAAGVCLRCGCLQLRKVTGYWEWYHSDELTWKQYWEKFDAGEFKL